jgi:hypothetical protein
VIDTRKRLLSGEIDEAVGPVDVTLPKHDEAARMEMAT